MEKIVVCIALLFSLLSACNPQTRQVIEERSTTDSAYITLSLNHPISGLRDGKEDPIARLENLTLFVFDGNQPGSRILDIRQIAQVTSSSISIKMQRCECYLLALANLNEKLEAQLRTYTRLEEFSEALNGDISWIANITNENTTMRSVTMSSSGDLTHITLDLFRETNEELGGKVCQIELEPMLARVIAYGTPTLTNDQIAFLEENVDFRTIYFSKSFYLQRHIKLEGESSPLSKKYAYSPGYEQIKSMSREAITNNVAQTHRVFPRSGLGYTPLAKDVASSDLTRKILYVKETTCPSEHYLVSLVPHVVIRAKIVPKGLKDKLTANEGWIGYKGSYMTEHAYKALVQEISKNIDAYNTPVADMHSSFLTVLKQGLKDNRHKAVMTQCDTSFTVNGIQFYHQSYNYYLLPIRHFDDGEAPQWNSFGRYGVVRNNQYTVLVKSIMGFGRNTFPSEWNLNPIMEKTPISFSLTIKALTNRLMEVDLE